MFATVRAWRQPTWFITRSLAVAGKTLPEKVQVELLCKPRQGKDPETPCLSPSKDRIRTRDIIQPQNATYAGNFILNWVEPPRNVLIVKKPHDPKTDKALTDIAGWLHQKYPQMNIIIEPTEAERFGKELPFVHVLSSKAEYSRVVDFVVTLGGDGTILHVSSLFPKAAPPVVSFSLGTLGFLMPFHISHFKHALEDVIRGGVSLLLRMRLACSLYDRTDARKVIKGAEQGEFQVMNEAVLHRGRYPHLTAIECFVDGQFLTDAVADGLIVATPTGSTAYSLSAGGPITHPSVQTLLLTPICPRSLSFRSVLLPPASTLRFRIGEPSRSAVEVSLDGRVLDMLDRGDYVKICMSKYPMPCVNRVDEGVDWSRDINDLLKWNQNFEAKSLLRHGYVDVD